MRASRRWPAASWPAALTDPLFIDATNASVGERDYHLRAYVQNGSVVASPAIDFAPPVAGDDRDLDDKPYDQDVPLVSDYQGVFGDAFGDPLSLVR